VTLLHTIAGYNGNMVIEERAHKKGAGFALLYLHAGKFVARSDLFLGDEVAARMGAHAITPHYSLAPSQPFPAAPEDAYRALEWAAKRYRNTPLVVMGQEAGGNLAAVVALMARDRLRPRIAAQILISPLLDATLCSRSMDCLIARYGAEKVSECDRAYGAYIPHQSDRTHPYASPAAASRMIGIAPALIVVGETDPLREDAARYGARLKAAGVGAEVRLTPSDLATLDAKDDALMDAIGAFVAHAIAPVATPAQT
jgi:acetyl esterase/lipase